MRFGFSEQEIRELGIAWILLSVAFALILSTGSFMTRVWLSLFTVGIGFLLHELAHKFVAQHYGKFAEFRSNMSMLVLSLVLAFFGTFIAAPGAVVISGFVSQKENGMIAAAGPLTNIVLAIVFLPLWLVLPAGGIFSTLASLGFIVNSYLALFNLLPFWIFDGAKVIAWNKLAYAMLALTSVLLLFVSTVFMQL